MAANGEKCSDCAWMRALLSKYQEDMNRKDEQIEHLEKLLWKSQGSWAEKEQAVEMDVVNASEEVVNVPPNEETE